MTRQHTTPLLLAPGGTQAVPLRPLSLQGTGPAVSEAYIQALVHNHPTVLPVAEIDPMFAGAVSICRELATPAGFIDNLLITPTGLPVLVECKLWRNPEGRREVVAQILDYAKELSRWSSSDLQREVGKRLGRGGETILSLVRQADPDVDETAFNDSLSTNLRRGRFLLLIVGDGIREGTEAIAEYLERHAGLHFSLGLIELPIYELPDGGRLVAPRILAKTHVVTRTVIAVPTGYRLADDEGADEADENPDPALNATAIAWQRFWFNFLESLRLDDPEQQIPKPARQNSLSFMLPAPQGSSWLTASQDPKRSELSVALSYSRNSAGEYAAQTIASDWEKVRGELNGTAAFSTDKNGRLQIADRRSFRDLENPEEQKLAFAWLAERVNTFVNVLRPRVRSAAIDYQQNNG